MIKVSNLCSPNGNYVPNQFKIYAYNKGVKEWGYYFQSYDSICALKIDGLVILFRDYDYSQTTSKYLNQFCGRTSREAKKEVENEASKFIYLDVEVCDKLADKSNKLFKTLKQHSYYQYNLNESVFNELEPNEKKIIKRLITNSYNNNYVVDNDKRGIKDFMLNILYGILEQ